MRERLVWEIQVSRAEGAIDVAVTRHRTLPTGMDADDAPHLDPGDASYLTAFWRLSSCRAIGMGLGQIPWRDIVAYAMHHGYDQERTDVLVTVIGEMDAGFLELEAQRAKDITKGGRSSGGSDGPAHAPRRTGGRR